jgi:glycosyltransferase involved in cell wall biosynthesis
MSAHEISAIIPTYNRGHLLARAIDSALAGLRAGDEVIVADDGSTDDTAAVVKRYGTRVRVLRLPHRGAGATRNRGIAAAGRPLVAFLDSDDEWMPDKLALQRALLAACPEVLFCFSDFAVRTAAATEPRYLVNWHRDPRGWDEILGPGRAYSSLAPLPPGHADFAVHVGSLYLAEMQRDYVATSTLMVRREEAGGELRFAEDVTTLEDWECFGRLAGRGAGAFLDCETAWQHGHAGPRLSDLSAMDKAAARLRILERVWGGDRAFLARHGEAYAAVISAQHRLLATCLIHQGHTREARAELRHLDPGTPALGHRLLAALPGGLVRRVLAVRSAWKAQTARAGRSS